jgi:DNA polymerase
MGLNQYSRKWEWISTYAGKWAEQATQGTARDILAHGLLKVEAEGYPIVLHVHDEILSETPDRPEFSAEKLSALMSTNPSWSVGLPLAAAGFETYRYRKD